MNIYIRVSENQKSVSGAQRWDSFDKRMILKKCWTSLMINVGSEDALNVYHHDVSDKTLKWLDKTSQSLINFYPISSIEESFSKPISDISRDVKIENDPNKLFALLEDDYLWDQSAFKVIKDTAKYWKGFIAPNDTPENYINPKLAKIFIGTDRHWRSTSNISWNLIGSQKIFKDWISFISSAGMDIVKLNNLLQNTDCLSPLPGLATHCKEGDMTPLVDWYFIWNGIKI